MTFSHLRVANLFLPTISGSFNVRQFVSKIKKLPKLSFQDARILECIRTHRLEDARYLLDEMLDRDSNRPVVVWTSLLSRYSKLGHVDEARVLLEVLPEKNVVSCNALLSGYMRSGRLSEGWRFFEEMPERDVVSWTCMVCGFADAGRIDEAWRLFEEMPERNVVTWNSMIVGLIRNGELDDARRCFDNMVERSSVSWNVMISGYVENGRMEEARSLFDRMELPNVVTWTTMVSGYCKVGNVKEAYRLFHRMPERNIVSWTAMIGGFAWNGRYNEALLVFLRMRGEFSVRPNEETLLSLAYACAGLGFPKLGKQLHAQIIINCWECEDTDGRLCRGLIHMYSSFGIMSSAHHIFTLNPDRCTVQSYNSMISGYIRVGDLEQADSLFNVSPIRDTVSWTSLIDGYFGVGEVAMACYYFHNMPDVDEVAWTVMISGHVRNELFSEAADLFAEMRADGFSPLNTTYSTLIGAAGALVDLNFGKQIHSLMAKTEPELGLLVENSLVSMYSKCGEIGDARRVFSSMVERDVISWNSMIMGFSNHGRSAEAFEAFEAMLESKTVPSASTFLALLSACNHAGLVSKGKEYFAKMSELYAIKPSVEHYISMINLLGRAGEIEEAEQLVLNLPFKPNHTIWGALLGACGFSSRSSAVAVRAAKEVLALDPTNAPAHVALCNVYAASGQHLEEQKLRKEMGAKGVNKVPGCSWFAHSGEFCSFLSGDLLSPEAAEMLNLVSSSLVATEDDEDQ
uniref:Chlororespiratory reduction 4 n=1 Tax=Kalanchoe fedtschenkoi TaxID=63787 RepID=A0A7N0RCX5_KALFE